MNRTCDKCGETRPVAPARDGGWRLCVCPRCAKAERDRAAFDALLRRRDELKVEHDSACATLAEHWTAAQDAKCLMIHCEIEQLQSEIDEQIAAEREA